MKILGWMHRKFRQNSVETHKDFPTGLSGHQTLEDLQCFPKGSSHFINSNKPFSKSQRERSCYLRNSFADLENARVEFEQDHQLFHGFLAIGTLGMEPITADEQPATPNFQISAVDHIAEKETEVTENELKLINDELEKVLGGAEEGKEEYRVSLSSGRDSHVSAGRISQCSVITLGDHQKVVESGGEMIPHGNESAVVCPLQSYLLAGSAAGMAEMPRSLTKKERRTSLEELFQKTKQADDHQSCYHGIKAKKKIDKEIADKSSVHLMMKKVLKRGNVAKNSGEYSAMAEKKLRKIRQMFSRKVHPEIVEHNRHQLHQPTKTEVKDDDVHVADYDDNGGGLRPSSEDDIIIYPERGPISNNHHPQITNSAGGRETVNGGNECWVKSDVDYLVLEL